MIINFDGDISQYGIYSSIISSIPLPKKLGNIIFGYYDIYPVSTIGTPQSLFNALLNFPDMNQLLTQIFDFTSSYSIIGHSISCADLIFFSRYGERKPSNFVLNNGRISRKAYAALNLTPIISIINTTFYDKWQSLYDTIIKEYDPIKPFNIILNETSTNTLTVDKDVSTYEDNDSTYGSNTNIPKPTDMSKGTRKNEYSRSNPTSRDYSRVGNIGNRSSAELIMQEREKLKFRLQDVIFEDILSIIARNSYGD